MQDTKNWFDKFENLPLLEALNKRVNLQIISFQDVYDHVVVINFMISLVSIRLDL